MLNSIDDRSLMQTLVSTFTWMQYKTAGTSIQIVQWWNNE